jgi:hypothetical protein
MQKNNLFKNYTIQGVRDKLDVLECFEQLGQSIGVGEMLEKQKQLYHDLGIEPLTSL